MALNGIRRALIATLAILVGAIAAPGLGAQEPAASAAYVIRSVSYSIEGRTKEYYLALNADIEIGRTFPDRESLDVYIADRLQVIRNERVLDSAEIDMTEGDAAPGERVPVDLVVRTTDTWNIVGLPYLKFDSNTGLLLALRGRDFDFFGSMEPLNLNLNWLIDEHGVNEPGVEVSFGLPFPAFGLGWTWNFSAEANFPADDPVGILLSTGFDVDLPVGPWTLTLSADEGFYAGQEDSDGVLYDDPYYLTSGAGASLSYTLYESRRLGKLTAGPRIDFLYRYLPGGLTDATLRKTPTLTPGVDIDFGRADWIGNFRRGVKVTGNFNLVTYLDTGVVSPNLTASVAAYYPLGFVGPSARLSGIYYFADTDSSAGDYLRGVLNSRIDTDAGIFLNLDLPLRVIDFAPADWFGIRWMRFLQFEQQWSPFLDFALVHDQATGRYFDPRDGWYGGGLEVITYPRATRSFYVRISAGWCLTDLYELKSLSGRSNRDGRDIREFFLGLGHHY
jgi:hypothetical protein